VGLQLLAVKNKVVTKIHKNLWTWTDSLDNGRPLGRPRRRWVDNIIMDLRQIGWYGLDRSGSG
jgi:hypothetical protein